MTTPTRYVFDLDGTLVDAFADLLDALGHALTRLGGRPLTMPELKERVGHGAHHLVASSCGLVGLPDEAVDEAYALFKAAYRGHCSAKTRAYEGVPALLTALGPERGAVLTNKPRAFALRILGELRLRALLGPVVGGDSLPTRKPDPSTLRFVARLWGAPLESLTMVGDSVIDVEVARRAGIPCVAVTWGQHGREVLLAAGATRIIDHPSELLTD